MPKMNPKHKKSAGLPENIATLGKGKLPAAKRDLGKQCSVEGCSAEAIHTLSVMEYESALKKASISLKDLQGARKFNICKDHYKKMKVQKKKEDKILKPKGDFVNQKAQKKDKIMGMNDI